MRRGASLIEVLVTIALVGAMFAALGAALAASTMRARARYETQAVALTEGAVAAALTLPAAALTDRSGAAFIGFTEKRGQWAVRAQAGAPSAANVLAVTSSSPASSGVTAAARLPDPPIANGTFSAAVYVPPNPPASWRVGLLFRSRDLGNSYRYTISANDLKFERLNDGAAAALYTLGSGAAPDTWTTLAVSGNGSSLSLSKDGVPLTVVTDAGWSFGDLALVTAGGLTPSFDDVIVSGEATDTWRFDSDAVGALPTAWRTVGVTDLPGGSGDLTIDHPFTGTNLSRVKARVQWRAGFGQPSVTATGYAR